jgi:hypothetical protein
MRPVAILRQECRTPVPSGGAASNLPAARKVGSVQTRTSGRRAPQITSDNHASSLRASHLQIVTSAIPATIIPKPPNDARALAWIIIRSVRHPTTPNQKVINAFGRGCIRKRPVRMTLPFLSIKRPRKNGLKELPSMGIARCSDTRDSVTAPTASCRANAENAERRVAAWSRSSDSANPNELSNSAGGDNRHRSIIFRIMPTVPKMSDSSSLLAVSHNQKNML